MININIKLRKWAKTKYRKQNLGYYQGFDWKSICFLLKTIKFLQKKLYFKIFQSIYIYITYKKILNLYNYTDKVYNYYPSAILW